MHISIIRYLEIKASHWYVFLEITFTLYVIVDRLFSPVCNKGRLFPFLNDPRLPFTVFKSI